MSGHIERRPREFFRHWSTPKIRFGDIDRHDHVNNVSICRYLEDARVEFREALCPAFRNDRSLTWLVAALSVQYLSALNYGDDVMVGTRATHVGRTSYHLTHNIFSADRHVALALSVNVMSDPSMKPAPLPAAFRAQLLAQLPSRD